MRLLRYGKGEDYGEIWRRIEVEGGVFEGGWVGRMMRGVRKHKLEEERWEVEKEKVGVVGWKIVVRGNKEGARKNWEKGRREREDWEKRRREREDWEKGRREREDGWVVGVSDASGEGRGMSVGGGIWEGGEEMLSWSVNGGRSLTGEMGKMYGVKKVLEKVKGVYRGNRRKLVVGVDNVGVLRKLGKGRGYCRKIEQEVSKIGLRLIEKGWEIKLM